MPENFINAQNAEPLPTLFDSSAVATQPHFSYRDAYRYAAFADYRNWTQLDSSIETYEMFFGGVLEEADGRIVNLLPVEPERPIVVVDIMATTAALHGLRNRVVSLGDRLRGFAVGLSDSRAGFGDDQDLTFIKGNVRHPETWRRLEEAMEGTQADLIMEHAIGGLSGLPSHPRFYETAFSGLWRLLRPGGSMLLQVPKAEELALAGVRLPEVVDHLTRQGIYAKTDEGQHTFISHMLIRKPS